MAERALARQAEPLTRKEKLALAEREALALFVRHRDNPSGLLEYFRQEGLEVHHANSGEAWVDELLGLSSFNALFWTPPSIQYPQAPIHDSPAEGLSESLAKALNRLNREKRFLMVLDKKQSGNLPLFHETFHLLQAIHGLPAWGRQEYPQVNRFLTWIHHQLKNPFSILGQRRLQGAPNLDRVEPDGPGAALRQKIAREFEAIDFIAAHADTLGISWVERMQNEGYRLINQWLWQSSYQLDAEA